MIRGRSRCGRLCNRAIRTKLYDHRCIIAGFAQYFVGMLADGRGAAWPYLVLTLDRNWTRDRQEGVVVERHQDFVGHDLLVIWDVLRRSNDVEYDSARGKYLAPFRTILGRKGFVEDCGQFHCVLHSISACCKPWVILQVFPSEALGKSWPLPFLVEDREDQPAPIAALIVVGESIQRLLARRAVDELGAAQGSLRHDSIAPNPVGKQRRSDVRAFPGELPLIQPHDDACIQRDPGWVIAHAGQRPRRRG